MRKVKLQMQVSLDGFVSGPNGEMDWMVLDWGEDIINYVKDITEPVDCILLGRVLAQGFIPHWAAAAENNPDSFTQKTNDTPKIVFSKTLTTTDNWKNAVLASDVVKTIAELKAQEGNDIIVYGGGSFVSHLIELNLIDEYHLFINPVLLGGGMPIFKDLSHRLNLKLVNTAAFECGIVVLCYKNS